MLAVAVTARALAATPWGEDTLSRGLRTSPLPGTHASVADCWQNSRCCHPYEEQHSFCDTLVSHPNVRAEQQGGQGRRNTAKNRNARPACLYVAFGSRHSAGRILF